MPRVFPNLLVVAVGQDPVLLLRVEEQAEDVEVQTVLLVGGAFVGADQQAALHLRIGQQHDLDPGRRQVRE